MGFVEYTLKRALALVPTLLGISIVVFLVLYLAPGDPVSLVLGIENYTEEQAQRVRERLGLDQPIHIQYFRFASGAVKGNFGDSIRLQRPALEVVLERLPATLELASLALLLAVAIAIPAGIISAVWRRTWADYGSMSAAVFGMAVPNFWLGLMLIVIFALTLEWLPPSGRYRPLLPTILAALTQSAWSDLWTTVKHLVLPVITLGTATAALLTRLVRSSMLDVLHQDYITTARAKGVKNHRLIVYHGLRNALIPVVTVVGVQMGTLIGGSVVTETIFAWPGVGRMAVTSIFTRDFPVVQATVIVAATLVVLINLVVDLLYGLIDPRIKY